MTVNDRRPNFRDHDGRLFLVRCFACTPEYGRENWALAVATGRCCWCGWPDPADDTPADPPTTPVPADKGDAT
jgi:hypothetical protein